MEPEKRSRWTAQAGWALAWATTEVYTSDLGETVKGRASIVRRWPQGPEESTPMSETRAGGDCFCEGTDEAVDVPLAFSAGCRRAGLERNRRAPCRSPVLGLVRPRSLFLGLWESDASGTFDTSCNVDSSFPGFSGKSGGRASVERSSSSTSFRPVPRPCAVLQYLGSRLLLGAHHLRGLGAKRRAGEGLSSMTAEPNDRGRLRDRVLAWSVVLLSTKKFVSFAACKKSGSSFLFNPPVQ